MTIEQMALDLLLKLTPDLGRIVQLQSSEIRVATANRDELTALNEQERAVYRPRIVL